MSHIAAEIKVRKLFILRYIFIALLTTYSTLTIAQPKNNIDSLLNILEESNNLKAIQ